MEVIKTRAGNGKKNRIDSDNNGGSWIRGKLLGKGEFGAVYLATSKGEGRNGPSMMAVKSADFKDSATLRHERKVMSGLAGCSSIVQCLGDESTSNRDGSVIYNLLLEYGSGGTLYDRMEATMGNGLPEAEVRWYARSLVEGLIKIQEAGFVHCDLKPDNILLFPNDDHQKGQEKFEFLAKICDFGLAKGVKEDIDRKKNRLPRTWAGTVGYVPPEAAEGRPQESAADIWSLGIIVLEMLTGRSAYSFDSENEEITIEKLRKQAWVPEISQDLSPTAKSFLHCCLRTSVKKRADAKSLLQHPFIAGIQDTDGIPRFRNSSTHHSLKLRKMKLVLHRLGSFLSLV